MQQLQELFLNFWYWWYVEQLLELVNRIKWGLAMLAGRLGLTRQLQSFSKPLYGDESFAGRIITTVFRSVWVLFALIVHLFAMLLCGLLLVLYLAFPLTPVLKLWSTLI
jgi:hypothetical protein